MRRGLLIRALIALVGVSLLRGPAVADSAGTQKMAAGKSVPAGTKVAVALDD